MWFKDAQMNTELSKQKQVPGQKWCARTLVGNQVLQRALSVNVLGQSATDVSSSNRPGARD